MLSITVASLDDVYMQSVTDWQDEGVVNFSVRTEHFTGRAEWLSTCSGEGTSVIFILYNHCLLAAHTASSVPETVQHKLTFPEQPPQAVSVLFSSLFSALR